MEHAVHLGACHFIQVVSPTSARVLVKKIKKALCDAKIDDIGIDLNTLEADPADEDDDDNDDNASEAEDFSVGDTIGKSLMLVKQVSTIWYKQIIMC